MGKINFTAENKTRLEALCLKFLFNNLPIQGPLGTVLRIEDLLHNTSISTLTTMHTSLKKTVATLEDVDEWTSTDSDKWKLERMKENLELVNLLIGYKRFLAEQEELAEKKADLAAKIAALKDSQKTPAERIAELEAELSTL